MKITKEIEQMIVVIRGWVKANGRIWSRKVLYELVSNQLVKDTSRSQYQRVCKIFKNLRHMDMIPYSWFRDKKTSVVNVGIGEMRSFDKIFETLCKYYKRDSKSFQNNYVEVWTEKELPDTIKDLLDEYEVGLLTSEGFVGDVAQYQAEERILNIKENLKVPITILYISDYDAEGEHIFNLMKERYESLGINIEKIAVKKKDVIKYEMISNIGYIERMMKPRTIKYHLSKQYVKDFLSNNTDLGKEGIVQYELDAYPVPILMKILKDKLDKLIDLKKMEDTEKLCKKEVKNWLKKYYVIPKEGKKKNGK